MATINCTAIRAHQALRAEGVVINLSGGESLSVLPVLSIGNTCVVSSSNKSGKIVSIDLYGHSFEVVPLMPNDRFDSNTPGILKVNELITVTY